MSQNINVGYVAVKLNLEVGISENCDFKQEIETLVNDRFKDLVKYGIGDGRGGGDWLQGEENPNVVISKKFSLAYDVGISIRKECVSMDECRSGGIPNTLQ